MTKGRYENKENITKEKKVIVHVNCTNMAKINTERTNKTRKYEKSIVQK